MNHFFFFFGFIMGFDLHRTFWECTMQREIQLHLFHVGPCWQLKSIDMQIPLTLVYNRNDVPFLPPSQKSLQWVPWYSLLLTHLWILDVQYWVPPSTFWCFLHSRLFSASFFTFVLALRHVNMFPSALPIIIDLSESDKKMLIRNSHAKL